jgi:hypothetical protein
MDGGQREPPLKLRRSLGLLRQMRSHTGSIATQQLLPSAINCQGPGGPQPFG